MCRTQRSQRDEPESSHKLSCYHQTLNKPPPQNSWYCILVHLHECLAKQIKGLWVCNLHRDVDCLKS